APDLLRGQDRLEVALLLLVGSVGDDDRAAHREPEDVGGARRFLARGLADEDRLLDQGRAAAAELLPPPDPGPAGVMEPALPCAAEFHDLIESAVGLGTRVILFEPGPDLVAELLLGWRQAQVHRCAQYMRPGQSASPDSDLRLLGLIGPGPPRGSASLPGR